MTRFAVVATVGLALSGCAPTQLTVCPACRAPVVYPPYKGKVPHPIAPAALPKDPGPGFIYTRVVYGHENDTAFGYVVHVSQLETRLLAVVGPLRHTEQGGGDFATFFGALCRTYGAHGPGQGVCCPEGTRGAAPSGGGGSSGGDLRPTKIALTPLPPPSPPPPLGGYALVYGFQQDAVNPADPQLAGDALGAASSGVATLNGG